MALNQRIRRLREELDAGGNPLQQSDGQQPRNQGSINNAAYSHHPQTSMSKPKSPFKMSESLGSQMRKAQMQTDRLLERARSRSPLSGSYVTEKSAIYVDTKGSPPRSISQVVSNTTDIELPIGQMSEDHTNHQV